MHDTLFQFRVVAEDAPDQPIIANSATGVWTAIVKRANEIRNRDHSNSGTKDNVTRMAC